MRLNDVRYPEGTPVDGYGPGFFRVRDEVIRGGLLILPGLVRQWHGFTDLAAIGDSGEALDVMFFGTGTQMTPLPEEMRARLETAGIAVESMNSPAACRTYNVLLSEGRRVGLAALSVD